MIRPRKVVRAAFPVFVLATLAAGAVGILAVWMGGFGELGWKVLWTLLIVVIASGLLLSASQRARPRMMKTHAQTVISARSTER
jgi:high-affinity Fe2+/Pb2+ permease